MKISGLTVARHAVKFDYPLVESIKSAIDLCDEYVVNIGADDEATHELLTKSIKSSKLKILRPAWDDSVREKGKIFSIQTNVGLDACQGDWIIYLQADEVLHEQDLPSVMETLNRELPHKDVDGFEMPFLNFYGRYDVVQDHPRKWHTKSVRIVRNKREIRSWDDAAGFRIVRPGEPERLLNHRWLPATVYHYGWCRHPKFMYAKQRHLERYYHSDAWVNRAFDQVDPEQFYNDRGHLEWFTGTHPRVMEERVKAQSWTWDPHIERQYPRWMRHVYLTYFDKLTVKWDSLGRFMKRFGLRIIGKDLPR